MHQAHKLGSGWIPHLLAGTPLAHIIHHSLLCPIDLPSKSDVAVFTRLPSTATLLLAEVRCGNLIKSTCENCRNMATWSVSLTPSYSFIVLTHSAMAFAMAHLIVT